MAARLREITTVWPSANVSSCHTTQSAPRRKDCACGHACRLTGFKGLAWCITGIEVLRYQQHGGTFRRGAGNVGAAQGISIHLNPVVGRLRQLGAHMGKTYAAIGVKKRHFLRFCNCGRALQKKLQGFLQRQAFTLRQGRNMGLCVSRKGVQGAIHLSISFADRCKY